VATISKELQNKNLEVKGSVQVLGHRSLTAKGVTYQVLDVYVENQGSATVFLKNGKMVSDLSGFQVGVYNARLSVVPLYHNGG